MIETVLYSVFGLSGLAILVWAVKKFKKWGSLEKEKEDAEASNEALSNRPHSLDDVIDRL